MRAPSPLLRAWAFIISCCGSSGGNRITQFIYNNKNLMEVLLYTILTLCALGVLSAVILYFVAQKFRVEEDPRIDEVEKMLPGANCGGCGFAGCRGLADALVKRDDISALFCPWAAARR